MRVGVYVDAFNVYYGGRNLCGRGTPGWRWLDLAGLATGLINPYFWIDACLERIVYCTAPRHREGDPTSFADQQKYIAALRLHCPGFTVANGRYVPRTKSGVLVERDAGSRRRVRPPGLEGIPDWLPVTETIGVDGQPELLVSISTFEEKGSDVNLTGHLLLDVLTCRVDAAMVLSNDSDLEFPLREARRLVPVATVNPSSKPAATALRGQQGEGIGGHWWRRLNSDDFRRNQMPEKVGPYRRPIGW